MEDSFAVKVDKVFGSLSGTTPYTSALWCLTDEEIEKKEWTREDPSPLYDDDDDDAHNFINSSGSKKPIEFPSDEDDVVDDDVDVANSKRNCLESRLLPQVSSLSESNEQDDELEVRASIGLDPTLDDEDEEDEYDKVAIGKEMSGERLYMKDVNDCTTGVSTFHELPDGFTGVIRDPRANHLAAKIRLKEDFETAASFESLKLTETSSTMTNSISMAEADISPLNEIGSQDYVNGGMADSMPILKNNKSGFKLHKQVGFEQQFDITNDPIRDQKQEAKSSSRLNSTDDDSLLPFSETTMDRSKYTHYSLESSADVDEESNRKAYMDFLNSIKKPNATEMQLDIDISKPPIFTPRKPYMVYEESKSKENQGAVSNDRAFNICIAAGDVEDNTESAMEEDDSLMVDTSVHSSGRRYRTKSKIVE